MFRFFILMTGVFVATGQRDKSSEIDPIFSWVTPSSPGCAVAVAQHGEVLVNKGYGVADLARGVPIGPETIFDAGSLMKQFVAAAALLLVEDGRMALTDDVRKYIPELHDFGHTIQVDHLLTHTSGLRDWTGLVRLAPGEQDALTLILRQRGLTFVPGEEWGYSNSGVVLMREIITRVSGMPFGEFARKRMFEPLGMKSTSFCEDLRSVMKNRALAYEKKGGGWETAMLLDEDRGGGGVFSTAADLIIWNEALTHNRLSAFVSQKLQEPATLKNGRQVNYGRGLIMDTYRGAQEVWHTGSAEGYKSYLGRFPEHGLSIAIMCNSGDDTERRKYAHRIFDALVPTAGPVEPEAGPPPPITGDVAKVNSKTGLFVNEQTGELLRLAMDRGRFRVADGPGLVQVSENHFRRFGANRMFMSGDEFELHFQSPDRFEMKSMDGTVWKYRRVLPHAPTPDELKVLAGRFRSDEIGAVVVIEPQEGALVMHLEHVPAQRLDFRPIDRDTFQFRRMMVRFVRDAAGDVTGLYFSNPVMANVLFTRLGADNGAAAGSHSDHGAR